MKHIVSLVIVILSLFAGSVTRAQAVTASVRSGAHDGFSRLAVDLPKRTAWRLSGQGRVRKLLFDGARVDFDLNDIFDRISGDRVLSVLPLQTETGLAVNLNCDCDVDVFWYGKSMLVVDIKDAVAGAAKGMGPPSLRPPAHSAPSGEAEPADWASARRLADVSAADGQDFALRLIAGRLASGPDAVIEGSESLMKANVESARRRIARDMASAAGFGLIDVRVDGPASSDGVMDEKPEDPVQEIDQAALPGSMPRHTNLVIHTGASEDIEGALTGATENAFGHACLPDNLLQIATWGTPAAFSPQIGEARTRLTMEFDRYDPTAALALARLYLYFGFGAEARQVIETSQLGGQAADVASAIAQLMEYGQTESRVFSAQADCGSDVALWATLAGRDAPPDVDAILRCLITFPDHLKMFIGPQLARKLLSEDRPDAAARILRILDRNAGPKSPEYALATAEVEMSGGDMDLADAALASVVDGNTALTADALVHRIANRIDAHDAVPRKMVDLAAAYAKEQKNTVSGAELARRYVEATAASGQYDLAFEEMFRLLGAADDEPVDDVVETVLEYTVANADVVAFLKHLATADPEIRDRISARLANRIARRLINLGFFTDAHGYLSGAADGGDLIERRLLQAEANLGQTLPQNALVDLGDVAGPKADLLRARARSQLGDHQAAYALYLAAGERKAAFREALLAENWTEARDAAAADLGKAFDRITGDPGAPTPSGILARNRLLLEQSADARRGIVDLLQADDISGDPGRRLQN